MEWFRELGRRLLMLFRRGRFNADLDEEMRLHRKLREREEIARGLSPQEAHYAAQRRFGNELVLREESRDMWGWNWLESLLQDTRYGVRMLTKNPGFTTVAVLTLALGIGANTAIFQLLDAVLFRSLPIDHPEELADIRIVGGNGGMGVNNGSYPQLTRPIWLELREHHVPFSGVFAWGDGGVNVGKGSQISWRRELEVSGEFFPVLGVRPWRGRLLLPEDETACPASRAVVSYAYWQSEMAGRDPGTGSTLIIDGNLVEVVGVTPPEFFGLSVGDTFDIALPFCQPQEGLRRDVFDIAVMGRLRPGWTLQRASAELAGISPGVFQATALSGRSAKEMETYQHFRLAAYPASNGLSRSRQQGETALWLLLAITGLVLLIACTNLANLILARSSTREREVAVRRALGASRLRLFGQMLAESVLLAGMGALPGIWLAQTMSRFLVDSFSTDSNNVYLPTAVDWRVLLFVMAVAVLTCVIFGVLPALRASNAEPIEAMKSGGRGLTASREHFSLQRLMVMTQIAVSTVLLVGAFLFVRSFRKLITFDPGMRESGITVAIVEFQQSHIPAQRLEEFKRQLLEEVQSAPGILSAATTTNIPLLGGSWEHGIHVGPLEGTSKFTWVSPAYFETMGIPLVLGRDFSQSDTATSPRVAVVNRTFVRRYLGPADPLGKTLRTEAEPNYPSTVYQIVGVIPDTKYSDLRGATPPMLFAPAAQYPAPGPWTVMMIRSNAPPAQVVETVKRRIAVNHPEIVTAGAGFEKWIRDGLVMERVMAMVSGFFGLLAAVLATIGLYGMISFLVARRRNEIGIRMTLGAQRAQVIALVLRETVRLLWVGIAAGTVLSLIAGRVVGSMLFELKPYDPLMLASATVLLIGVALAASYIPARRATKVDPMVALRYE